MSRLFWRCEYASAPKAPLIFLGAEMISEGTAFRARDLALVLDATINSWKTPDTNLNPIIRAARNKFTCGAIL